MISLEGYQAARERSAFIDRSDMGTLLVSGKDRTSFLHGLLTNDIAGLHPGRGCYAAYLTPQGRMTTDLWVHDLGDVILLTLGLDVKDAVLSKLDQVIFNEDVQLADLTATLGRTAIVGPGAAQVVASMIDGVTFEGLTALPDNGNARGRFENEPAIVLRTADLGEAGFEVLVDPAHEQSLRRRAASLGSAALDTATAEVLRIEGGVPRFHQDMDEETIPLEAGIESRAISLTKGCYVGQEVIVRVLHRGHGRVARKLVGLTLSGGGAPAPGSVVHAAGRDIGRVTSSVNSPALDKPIALAYVQRDFVEPGQSVDVGGIDAVVTALPFVKLPLPLVK